MVAISSLPDHSPKAYAILAFDLMKKDMDIPLVPKRNRVGGGG